jgi:outer membrane biosynthesis protein TonB
MTNDKKELKVTDKRIFTAEGEIRDEFKNEIRPADPAQAVAEPAPAPEPKPEVKAEAKQEPKAAPKKPADNKERRSIADRAGSPETPFANFIEPLIAQAYMSLGMLRNPYQPQAKVDPGAARQMIDILNLLQEKTAGNLTAEEEDFLTAHLGELKLAYVQRTKSI